MTSFSHEDLPVYGLVGQPLTDLGAHYEILILRFGEYEIHASCFARIIHGGRILLTTRDYQSWDGQDHRHNDMYVNIARCGEALIGRRVRSVEVSAVRDLTISLDNGAEIQIFSSEGPHRLTPASEQWFFYKPGDRTCPYLSVTNSGIEIENQE